MMLIKVVWYSAGDTQENINKLCGLHPILTVDCFSHVTNTKRKSAHILTLGIKQGE